MFGRCHHIRSNVRRVLVSRALVAQEPATLASRSYWLGFAGDEYMLTREGRALIEWRGKGLNIRRNISRLSNGSYGNICRG